MEAVSEPWRSNPAAVHDQGNLKRSRNKNTPLQKTGIVRIQPRKMNTSAALRKSVKATFFVSYPLQPKNEDD